jgi:hypothetical protein
MRKKKKLHHSSHISLVGRPMNKNVWNEESNTKPLSTVISDKGKAVRRGLAQVVSER